MDIKELRATSVTACPGSLICAAEAYGWTEDHKEVYVSYSEGDTGEHFSVARESVYDFLMTYGAEAPEFLEDYEEEDDAMESEYGKLFAYLKETARTIHEWE